MKFGVTFLISDHQQGWGYEEGPRRGRGHALLVVADLIKQIRRSDRLGHVAYVR